MKTKSIISFTVVIIALCIVLSSCNTAKQSGFLLHETPQIYVLQDEDTFALMPTVTLYENGDAWLSQPLISSYALSEIGRYEVHGDELTITHKESISATFQISDDGDTLTLLSSNLNFTKSGTVYRYQAMENNSGIPEFETREWIDYYDSDDMPWNERKELTLKEFPGVIFTWTSEIVAADDEELFRGMPVWNIYLTDLTNDGKPEFCATVSIGSGIIDNRVIVFDYVTGKEYQLSDRMAYDYYLSMDNGKIMITQTDFMNDEPLATAELRLVEGEIFRFGNIKEK